MIKRRCDVNKLITAKKCLPVALALAGFAIAGIAPALAQSFNPEIGTGNSLQFSYGQSAQTKQLAARQNGLDAFAMIPRASSTSEAVPFGLEAPDRFGIESQR
jgi:hypothetical protein